MPDHITTSDNFSARDELAARFATALLSGDPYRWPDKSLLADTAYQYADAFLDERSKN